MYRTAFAWPLLAALAASAADAAPADVAAVVRRAEREMAQRPQEAFLIARRAADQLTGHPEPIRSVFRSACQVLERRLPDLAEAQVAELAEVYAKTLDDRPAATAAQRRWLTTRARRVGAADGRGLVHLARLWLRWLNDRHEAARLCQEALRREPGLAAATQMLQHDLGYRLTEAGWVPREQDRPATGKTNVQPGMTRAEVRRLLGSPRQVSRQILSRRLIEQWSYGSPADLWVQFLASKGEEPHVLTVHQASAGKP